MGESSISDNKTLSEGGECQPAKKCVSGLILPAWPEGEGGLALGDRIIRGVIYFLFLCYLFLGISIISDRFMGGIEVITSQEHRVKMKRIDPRTGVKLVTYIKVRIWNETVANLTLMALGSSAPEILLSVIEICGNNFNAGELGPGTIVGSAAYNLFIIVGICVAVVGMLFQYLYYSHFRFFILNTTPKIQHIHLLS